MGRTVETELGPVEVGFTFIPNDLVFWGCVVAFGTMGPLGTRPMLYAGPLPQVPDAVMASADELHVHPDTYELIHKKVAETEEGLPHEPQEQDIRAEQSLKSSKG